ncbi:cysteine desulfurase family protein [Methylovirgula sp. 4M-Z18]|uniref:cysteine desulfurase family protein n=1 Tax=Methylovirgula sp. 4M-Z18 TaxID=2293567 RepID=UPI000E2E8D30|nr:cysteine desulfurase family protein [Methylovirgula sp. 4M-Z18]RFB80791.1 cysteine desulfurase [Methylovirgula sp. 4M-Z18]
MAASRLYLDNNATTPLRLSVRAAMLAAFDLVGNASSIHSEGRAARALIEEARRNVAALTGAKAKNVIFTSGGTEAANLALTPHVHVADERRPFARLLVSATEHPCVLSGYRFASDQVTLLPVTSSGVIDLHALDHALAAGERCTVAVQAANNETGVLQPIRAIADKVHARGSVLICDAVQAAGKVRLDMDELGADMLLLSAHKFGGPKGAGALVLGSDRLHIADPLLKGGGQERGFRAGTENVAAIAGFGQAAQDATGWAVEAACLKDLRDGLEVAVRHGAPDMVVFGRDADRLPNTLNFAVPGVPAETLLMALDLDGIAASSGSACSSGKLKSSHVLAAMQVPAELASGAIRLSLGWASTWQDVEEFENRFAGVAGKLRKVKSAA